MPPQPTDDEVLDILERFFMLMLEFRDAHYALHMIRSRISWMARPLQRSGGPSIKPFKEAIRLAPSPEAVRQAIAEFRAGGLRDAAQRNDSEIEVVTS